MNELDEDEDDELEEAEDEDEDDEEDEDCDDVVDERAGEHHQLVGDDGQLGAESHGGHQ